MLREAAPFLVGMVLPPGVMLASRLVGGRSRLALSFAVALIVGFCVSLLAGELAAGMPAMMAVIIDTSLAYTGSQIAYHLVWKAALKSQGEPRIALGKGK